MPSVGVWLLSRGSSARLADARISNAVTLDGTTALTQQAGVVARFEMGDLDLGVGGEFGTVHLASPLIHPAANDVSRYESAAQTTARYQLGESMALSGGFRFDAGWSPGG